MNAPDRAEPLETSPEREADRLLGVIAAMLRELRLGEPHVVRLDDSITADLGIDSLSRVELVARVEAGFGVRLPERLAAAARTPRDLLQALERAQRVPGKALARPVELIASPLEIEGAPDSAPSLVDAFCWHVEHHPEREHITILAGDTVAETFTYATLWADANEAARGLAAEGTVRGDAVALMLPTGGDFFRVFLGALILGAVPVPLYPPLRWSQIAEHVRGRAAILANSAARLLVTVPEAMPLGRLVRVEVPSLKAVTTIARLREADIADRPATRAFHDIALLQYTSGSTGDPKGVILSHANLLANIRTMGSAARVRSTDRFVSWLPLYHDMGLIGAWLATMYHAVPLVLMPPTAFLGRPARWLWTIHRWRATISAGPNFAYEIAATKIRDEDLAGLDLRSWRLAFNGAEPVRAATLRRFEERFAPYGFDRRAMTPVYGLAEGALGLAFPTLDRGPWIERIDPQALAIDGIAVTADAASSAALEVVSCGMPLAGHEARIVDPGGREVPERTEGRIEFRGPSATSGYFRNPEATAKLFHEGWLDTGDIGYIAAGELFVTSRAKDLIKRGGHNLHPYDLEAAIGDLRGIRKGCVAVFGVSDRMRGTERVVVVAETAQAGESARNQLAARIQELATIHLDGPADEIVLAEPHTVLKTSSGKIRRAACRDLYEKGMLPAPRRAVWLQLAGLVAHAAFARLARESRRVTSALFALRVWLAFVLVTVPGLVLLMTVPGEGKRIRLARRCARLFVRLAGLRLVVHGLENLPPQRPLVVVANHSSYVDAIVLVATLPLDLHFAAKREFADAPVLGWAMRRLGTHFVEHVDAVRGAGDTRGLTAAIVRGQCVAFFPEGTFSRAPGLAAFRLGAFVVAAESDVVVVPVLLRGTRSLLREGRWLPESRRVEIDIQAPLMPHGADWSAAIMLRDRVRNVMLAHCGEPDLAP